MKIRKGDKIKVVYGSLKGKTGTVEKVFSVKNSVLVGGVNLVKKHLKSQGVIELLRPINVTKVVLVCPKCQKETRVQLKDSGGRKTRVCKECGSEI